MSDAVRPITILPPHRKRDFGFEKSVPRCGCCRYFHDAGPTVKKRGIKRRYHCKKFGWAITRVSVCDKWRCKRTGETFEVVTNDD